MQPSLVCGYQGADLTGSCSRAPREHSTASGANSQEYHCRGWGGGASGLQQPHSWNKSRPEHSARNNPKFEELGPGVVREPYQTDMSPKLSVSFQSFQLPQATIFQEAPEADLGSRLNSLFVCLFASLAF